NVLQHNPGLHSHHQLHSQSRPYRASRSSPRHRLLHEFNSKLPAFALMLNAKACRLERLTIFLRAGNKAGLRTSRPGHREIEPAIAFAHDIEDSEPSPTP